MDKMEHWPIWRSERSGRKSGNSKVEVREGEEWEG